MDNWNALMRRIAEAGGVGTPADARACGVSEATWHRRTRDEGWGRPYPRVRVAPWAPAGPVTDLRAALAACRGQAVAAGMTAMWVAGVGSAPRALDLVVPHHVTVPNLGTPKVRVRRARWLKVDEDVVVEDGIARLTWPAIVVSMAGLPSAHVRGLVIDAAQAGRVTPDDCFDRLATVGPVDGRGALEQVLLDLGGRHPESWFHDIVLTDLLDRGYPAGAEPLRVDTPDGRGIVVDIPLQPFLVGVEPEGDSFHREARARRNDRRRRAQVAGTDWVIVPVDWRDWHQRRRWVLDTIDATIGRQVAAGHGTVRDLPAHLRPSA